MAKTKKGSKYPRTLYKRDEEGKLSFTNKKHRDVKYNSVIVNDEEELKEAVNSLGYIDKFSSILSEKAAAPEESEDEDEGDEESEAGNEEEF